MKLHHLKPAEGAKKDKIRVGRGDRGRRGKTAGRGTKGTGARGNVKPGFEGGQLPLQRRQPKLGGFTRRNPEPPHAVLNVERLETMFNDGDEVTLEVLRERRVVPKGRKVKILGHGELTKKLVVDVDAVSASAREKIVAAGGEVRE